MNNYNTSNGMANQPAVRGDSRSRIEADVELVKGMIINVESITDRIIRHARSLGYFEPPSDGKQSGGPAPVITTLADALQTLNRALDHCSGSLNVFD